mgnify:CR=1 FL=1
MRILNALKKYGFFGFLIKFIKKLTYRIFAFFDNLDAKLTLKFGKVRRRISLSEFTGLIAEYDITEQLELHADGSVSETSIRDISDKDALSFMQEMGD